jgi:AAA domain
VAGRLAQAYAHHFDQQPLTEDRAALAEVHLLATRHGRSSTTLVLAAPLAARPLLLRQLPVVAELAFGDRVDVEGLVSHEGDVVIRLTGVARQAAHLRAAAVTDGERPEVWPRPRLVPLGVLNDHQVLAANWNAVGRVLVAAPLGQGAATALVALLAPLLARATPDEFGLEVIAGPGSLPAELLAAPHLRGPVVGPRRLDAVHAALDRVHAELERRRAAQPHADDKPEPELLLLVRELAELEPDTVAGMGPILLDGPRHGIRLLAASERPATELLQACPVLGEFGTRLMSQPKHNLPAELTSFVGRELECIDVSRRLEHARLLTIVGVGGVGKTRLALCVARNHVDTFADGVWFIPLESLTEPALIAGTVARALGLREQAGADVEATLLDAVAGRGLLLVLDNCEHLAPACAALVERVLRTCPRVRVLATSREPLGVPGEVVWRSPALSVVPVDRSLPFDTLAGTEAVRLFADRAAARVPEFRVAQGNVVPVAQICWRLDGIPLAIELAAARLAILSPGEIAARLDDRFSLHQR